MRTNPRFDASAGECDVLDELEAFTCHSTASSALIELPISAERMLHKL